MSSHLHEIYCKYSLWVLTARQQYLPAYRFWPFLNTLQTVKSKYVSNIFINSCFLSCLVVTDAAAPISSCSAILRQKIKLIHQKCVFSGDVALHQKLSRVLLFLQHDPVFFWRSPLCHPHWNQWGGYIFVSPWADVNLNASLCSIIYDAELQ